MDDVNLENQTIAGWAVLIEAHIDRLISHIDLGCYKVLLVGVVSKK